MESLHSCTHFIIFVPILHLIDFIVNYVQVPIRIAQGVGIKIEESIESFEANIQDLKKINGEFI